MKGILAFAFTFLFLPAAAQEKNTISGKVVNTATRSAIANASVFLNNTSKGTITDTAGNFVLTGLPAGSYELIISCVGYTTVVKAFTDAQLPLDLRIELALRVAELDSVTVEPYDKNGWRNWGRLFTNNFIGSTPAANECVIKNYKVIRFRLSKKTNRLTAIADEPLIIENKALGYTIQYQLEEFVYDLSAQAVVYLGYPLFTKMSTARKRTQLKWVTNRQTAYTGSFTHFIRSLYNNRFAEEGFEVRRQKKVPNKEKQRIKGIYAAEERRSINSGGKTVMKLGTSLIAPDSVDYYNRIMAQPDMIDVTSASLLTADSVSHWSNDSTRLFYFTNTLAVTFTNGGGEFMLDASGEMRTAKRQRSVIFLVQAEPVVVLRNGNYYPPQNVFLMGYWAWSEKMAHLLPIDYEGGSEK
jgi:hypothetical protein